MHKMNEQQYASERQQLLEHVTRTGHLPVVYAANGTTPVVNLALWGTRANGGMAQGEKMHVHPKPMDFLNANSQRDNGAHPLIVNGTNAGGAVKPIGSHNGPRPRAKKDATFSTDIIPDKWVGNRFVLLSNVCKEDLSEGGSLKTLSESCHWELELHTSQALLNSATGKFDYYLVFNDLRAAEAAHNHATMYIDNNACGWNVSWSSFMELSAALASSGKVLDSKLAYYEGQIMFFANFKGPSAEFAIAGVEDAVHKVAETYGQISAFKEVEGAEHPRIMFRVEYFRISDAQRALKEASQDEPRVEQKWHIHAEELKPSPKPSSPVNGITNALAVTRLSTPHRTHDGAEVSPTGRTGWRVDENGNTIPVLPKRTILAYGNAWTGMPAMTSYGTPGCAAVHRFSEPVIGSPGMVTTFTPRSGSYPGATSPSYLNGQVDSASPTDDARPVPGPQTVEIVRIIDGQDLRTTLMLRNIPNRMMAQELKAILDKTSFGKYDFSYLRIDFEKGTNVGYAFVNFADAKDIIAFVKEYMGKQWAPPNKRVVELSYATIQGLDCLIEKFRNSAVMSECPDYRPMMWFTEKTAPSPDLIGEPANFPAPNNNMKLQRSHDNAGQVGLYAPRSIRQSRSTHGRYSNFDRGTPHQLYEEAYHQQMSPNSIPHNFGHYTYQPQPQYPVMQAAAPPAWHMPPYPHPGMMGYVPNQHMPVMPYGHGFTNVDPFYTGHGNNNNTFQDGYSNGHQRPFGTGPDVPDSRRRNITNGHLGYAPKKHMDGGPVQPPANFHVPRTLNGEHEVMKHARKAVNAEQGACRNPSPHQL